MIFVDTGAWFALAVKEDPDHEAAVTFLGRNREPLATSDMVAVETMNLLRFRKRDAAGHALALRVGADIWEKRAAVLLRTTGEEIERARQIFETFSDKLWSFTDCTSMEIMERRGIHEAFAFDRHFEQFGGITRRP